MRRLCSSPHQADREDLGTNCSRQDMHWAEFGEEEVRLSSAVGRNLALSRGLCCSNRTDPYPHFQSAQLLAAIKEYDANKWKTIGQKLGKPAKVWISCSFRFLSSAGSL